MSQALACAKCPQPMKGTGGRCADSGEGWLARSTQRGPAAEDRTERDLPHLWMGDTLYRFASIDEALFRGIVDVRAQQKFNHLRGLVLSPETEARAFASPDQVNPEYFRELDERIRYMNSKGIVADLVLAACMVAQAERLSL